MIAKRFEIGPSVPVMRMLDEGRARAFYVEYLGFEVDWEHRFTPDAPLYMQVHLGGAVLHLDGHADDSRPTTEVRIPVDDLAGFAGHLKARRTGSPDPVDPRHTGRPTDLNLLDPFGNSLVFWERP